MSLSGTTRKPGNPAIRRDPVLNRRLWRGLFWEPESKALYAKRHGIANKWNARRSWRSKQKNLFSWRKQIAEQRRPFLLQNLGKGSGGRTRPVFFFLAMRFCIEPLLFPLDCEEFVAYSKLVGRDGKEFQTMPPAAQQAG